MMPINPANWSLVNATSAPVTMTTTTSGIDNYTVTYVTSLLNADLAAIIGQSPLNVVTSYAYGLVFPIIAAFGVVGNMTTAALFWFVSRFRSHDTGSMASLFVGAHLFADALFLVCFVLSTTPAAVVSQRLVTVKYRLRGALPNASDTEWAFQESMSASGEVLSSIGAAQMLFMKTSALGDTASTVSLWYVIMLIGEHYVAVRHAKWLSRRAGVNFGTKLIVSVTYFCLVGKIVGFFTFTVNDIVVGSPGPLVQVCESAFYRSRSTQVWDRYIYFAVFNIVPCLLGFYLLAIVASDSNSDEGANEDTDDDGDHVTSWAWRVDEAEMVRLFRDVRSTRLVLVLGSFALLFNVVSSALYLVIVRKLTGNDDEFLSANCHILPYDVRLDYNQHGTAIFVYHVIRVLPACLKPFVVLYGFEQFQRYCCC